MAAAIKRFLPPSFFHRSLGNKFGLGAETAARLEGSTGWELRFLQRNQRESAESGGRPMAPPGRMKKSTPCGSERIGAISSPVSERASCRIPYLL